VGAGDRRSEATSSSWIRPACGGAPVRRYETKIEAVLSDNAKCYTGHLFAHTLDDLGARHIRIPPYTPRWNGKLERFFGTLEDEWAHGRTWPNSATRDRALSSFIRYFNRWRPHSAAGGRPPITRVHQDRKQDS
jgi:transposase InsO family protein